MNNIVELAQVHGLNIATTLVGIAILVLFRLETHWEDLNEFFAYTDEIRRVIYTTNAIEITKCLNEESNEKPSSLPR